MQDLRRPTNEHSYDDADPYHDRMWQAVPHMLIKHFSAGCERNNRRILGVYSVRCHNSLRFWQLVREMIALLRGRSTMSVMGDHI